MNTDTGFEFHLSQTRRPARSAGARFMAGSGLPLLILVGGCTADAATPVDSVRIVLEANLQVLPVGARFGNLKEVVETEGALWILDDHPPFLTRACLEDGTTIQFGFEGDGPGELRNPVALQPVRGGGPGEIMVWDHGKGRVLTFDWRGNLVASESLGPDGRIPVRNDMKEVSFIDPFRVRALENGIVLARFRKRVEHSRDMVYGTLTRTDRRLGEGQEIVSLDVHAEAPPDEIREWDNLPLWDACDGTITLWSPATRTVQWHSVGDPGVVSAPVPFETESVTEGDILAFLRWMARLEIGPTWEQASVNLKAAARERRVAFASQAPIATDIRCESRTVAWIMEFATESDPLGRGARWTRIAADAPPTPVRFPPAFTPTVFTDEGAYGILQRTDGTQAIAWWLAGPEPPPRVLVTHE